MNQLILENRQSETLETLNERTPIIESTKQYSSGIKWKDLRCLF